MLLLEEAKSTSSNVRWPSYSTTYDLILLRHSEDDAKRSSLGSHYGRNLLLKSFAFRDQALSLDHNFSFVPDCFSSPQYRPAGFTSSYVCVFVFYYEKEARRLNDFENVYVMMN